MEGWDLLIESTITAFNLDRATKELQIDVTSPWENKPRMRIVATEVEDLAINEMRLYNVIDRVIVFGADDATSENPLSASPLFFLMQGRAPTASDLEWPVFKEKFSLIQDGKLTLMEIEPVCGASFIILAERFKLEEISANQHPATKN